MDPQNIPIKHQTSEGMAGCLGIMYTLPGTYLEPDRRPSPQKEKHLNQPQCFKLEEAFSIFLPTGDLSVMIYPSNHVKKKTHMNCETCTKRVVVLAGIVHVKKTPSNLSE